MSDERKDRLWMIASLLVPGLLSGLITGYASIQIIETRLGYIERDIETNEERSIQNRRMIYEQGLNNGDRSSNGGD